jgi:hypothetical protein
MHKIKEILMAELYDYEEKLKKAGDGKLSAGDLETLHKLTDTVKNIDKIEMLEGDEGYSEATDFMGEGRMYGMSYGRGRNAKRDSMGRYSRADGHMMDGTSYRRGSSYATDGRGNRNANYSRGDAKEHMLDKLEEMMEDASSEKDREAIRQCMHKIENA